MSPSAPYDSDQAFLAAFLDRKGTAFETLFQEVMERVHPDDFRPVRAHGSIGDRKCDGYLESEQTVFQVYAPDRGWRLDRLLAKIEEDYLGACKHWPAMQRWVFVHNVRDGLPADAVQLLEALPSRADGPPTGQWGYEELRRRAVRPDPRPPRPSLDAMRRYWSWRAADTVPPPEHLRPLHDSRLPIRLAAHDAEPLTSTPSSQGRRSRVGGHRQHVWKTAASGTEDSHEAHVQLYRAFRKHRHTLVVGDSGCGKSTLLERFARAQARHLLDIGPGRGGRHTPVLVELWRFGPDQPLLDLVAGAVRRSDADVPLGQVQTALELGYVLALFDGLDEVPPHTLSDCLAAIHSFTERFPRAPVVLASRPGVRTPRRFTRLDVVDLGDDHIQRALDHVQEDADLPPGQARGVGVFDLPPSAREICRRPLTLGFVLYGLSRGEPVPSALYELYRKMEAWLLDWDVGKDRIRSAYGSSSALQRVAYGQLRRGESSTTEADWIADAAAPASDREGVREAEAILRHALSAGLVRREGGVVRFSHRSFLDYFAARQAVQLSASASEVAVLGTGVVQFVASAAGTLGPYLDAITSECQDVRELVPLFDLAWREEMSIGDHEMLAAAFAGEEDWVHRLAQEETVSDYADWLVSLSEEYAPKARSLVSEAAWVALYGLPDPTAPPTLRRLAKAFETYSPRTARYYQTLADWVQGSAALRHDEGAALYFGPGGGYDEMNELPRVLDAEDFAAADSLLRAFSRWLAEIEDIHGPQPEPPPVPRCPSTLDLFDDPPGV